MIKNYTSDVQVVRSVDHIESKLVEAGATNVMKLYKDKSISGIAFILDFNGKQYPFKLPARVEEVEKIFAARQKRNRTLTESMRAQAHRTAWKLLSDWVDIQCSFIEMKQSQFMEILMAFIYNPMKDETLFQSWEKSGRFAELEYKR
jgi:hypothetical protein